MAIRRSEGPNQLPEKGPQFLGRLYVFLLQTIQLE